MKFAFCHNFSPHMLDLFTKSTLKSKSRQINYFLLLYDSICKKVTLLMKQIIVHYWGTLLFVIFLCFKYLAFDSAIFTHSRATFRYNYNGYNQLRSFIWKGGYFCEYSFTLWIALSRISFWSYEYIYNKI